MEVIAAIIFIIVIATPIFLLANLYSYTNVLTFEINRLLKSGNFAYESKRVSWESIIKFVSEYNTKHSYLNKITAYKEQFIRPQLIAYKHKHNIYPIQFHLQDNGDVLITNNSLNPELNMPVINYDDYIRKTLK